MTKIDIDRFVASLIEFSPQQSMKYIKALEDQGLKYKDGKIVSTDSDFTTITIPKDLKGTDTDGGVVGEKGEQGEQSTNKNFKEKYENIAKSDWFKKTHKDISIGEEQPTEEEMVGMRGLGKVWKEQAIISILDKIYDWLLLRLPIHYPISSPNIDPPIIYDTNETYCDATTSTEGGEE